MRKRVMKWLGTAALVMLLVALTLGIKPWKVFAQADSGYTLVGTTSALTFTDATVAASSTYQYEVTAFNAAGESVAVKGPVGTTTSAAGSHSATSSWGASPTAGASYHIYRTQITIPNPPAAGSVNTIFN